MAKVIIVTGASGNLGSAIVSKFLAEGYRVVGSVTSPKSNLAFTGDKFEKMVVDLTDEKSSATFVESVIEKYGAIDAAVLTVGGFAMGKISDTSSGDMKKQYELNFTTAYNAAQPIFKQMLKQKTGRLFMIGSKPGLDMHDGKSAVAYALSKSLIFRLAELMNLEAKDTSVVTTVVVPSTIDTPQNRKDMPDDDFSKWVKPVDIADVIYFHSSDDAQILREPIIKVYNEA